ncbi:glycosyltransferase family 2 protein [Agromyces larvae]|uniref:Glycosyltransferase n=1 Tax=Agromyces larvae TaxID=2929802 RepID=A0ABY4BU67_9MICO|nr:glycosyltransferase family 2 protein [Agromyces larvae]UOE42758.1 glycosyltransferase [Agromyces larvae]
MRFRIPIRRKTPLSPTVTAVVPCYNYGKYLPDCVRSVLGQPHVEASVIIVDDCSTDGSWQVAQMLAAQNPRVRAVHHERNEGAVATFNHGISLVEAEYLVLISADDALAPGALARATALMAANPQVGLVYGHTSSFSGEIPRWRERPVSWSIWSGEEWLRAQFRLGWNSISSPEAVVRTSVQHAVGGYDADFPHTHDLEMWLRIAAISDVGHINGPDQAFHRDHGSNLSGAFTGARDLEERFRAYSRFLDVSAETVDVASLRPVLIDRAAEEAMALGLEAAAVRPPDADAVTEAQRLAQRIDPGIANRPGWRELEAARKGALARATMRERLRKVQRRIDDRRRWWRWRLIGA